MLKIRSEHTATYARECDREFCRAVAHLRKELPDRVKDKSDQQLDGCVRDVMERGRPFGSPFGQVADKLAVELARRRRMQQRSPKHRSGRFATI
jgi:hypothetical protein